MKKQILMLFICMLCMSSLVMAGVTGKISGKVSDAETSTPLPGANILIEGTNLGAATDAEGEYFIINIPPGTYTVKATMMGYKTVNQTEITVSIDRSITVNFILEPTVIEGEVVTIVAEREAVQKDVSSSKFTVTQQQIEEVPLVQDVQAYIEMQAGIEGELIRGGGLDQTALVVDGLTMVNNAINEPMNIVNLSAIEEVSVIRGGFEAEYGNIRSGLINIVTKEGTPKFHGGIDYRYTVSHQKHRGYSLFDYRNFYLRPYLDPEVCWVGTKNGPWNKYAREQYVNFMGWNKFVEKNPELGLTPEEARNLFIWQHRAEGNKDLGIPSAEDLGHPHPGEYGNKPDINTELNLGGPIPVIGKYLGNMTFFLSYRENVEQYAFPSAREPRNFTYMRRGNLKLTSRISPTMKLGIEGFMGLEKTAGAESGETGGVADRGAYFAHGGSPMDIDQSFFGITFDHVLSPRTFYNVRLSRLHVANDMYGARIMRDPTILATFGNVQIDERPWGFYEVPGYQYALGTDRVIGGIGGGGHNNTKVTTYIARVDLTSQINKYNQIKSGFEIIYDDIDFNEAYKEISDVTGNYELKWDHAPLRMGAYIQDKLEFEGMIANIGIRMDYNEPNTEWYTVDRYSKYFSRIYKSELEENGPKEEASGHVKLAPRLGISHPISDVSKLFFSYGHFYSMPVSNDMYQIHYGVMNQGIEAIGNPNLKMPRTIAYELGYEHEIADMFLITLTGYYKDVTNEIGYTRYINFDQSVDYGIPENTHYADTRGFEIEVRKNWGKWITGWLNYTYMVTTNGLIGREANYQDVRVNIREGKRNPQQEKPLPLPFARGFVQVRTPFKFGPQIGGIYPLEQIAVSMVGHYFAGDYLTWDPLYPFPREENNLQWKHNWDFDMRIMKTLRIGKYEFEVFADIVNVFDIKRLNGDGFMDEADRRDYLNSLHLPMYGEGAYKNDPTFTAGDDKVGDVWSEDKPYINMPNVDFLAWNAPRSITIGLQFNF